jgi:hypothetical protein
VARQNVREAVRKGLVCGQLIIEQRELLERVGGETLEKWCQTNLPDRPMRTIYRYIALTDRVLINAQIRAGEIESSVLLSDVLSLPGDQLPEKAREAKLKIEAFIAGKTMTKLLSAGFVHEEQDAARQIQAGARGGYCGEDRADWALFGARALERSRSHLSRYNPEDSDTAARVDKYLAAWLAALPDSLIDELTKLAAQIRRDRREGAEVNELGLKRMLKTIQEEAANLAECNNK